MGEKGIIFEPFSQEYTHMQIYLAILSDKLIMIIMEYLGIEKYFDKELKNKNLLNRPLQLTLDANIQYLISQELKNLY